MKKITNVKNQTDFEEAKKKIQRVARDAVDELRNGKVSLSRI